MQQPTSAPSAPDLSETHARLTLALGTALGPLVAFLDDPLVVEIMLNADGAIWVERRGAGMQRTEVRMDPVAAEAMLRLVWVAQRSGVRRKHDQDDRRGFNEGLHALRGVPRGALSRPAACARESVPAPDLPEVWRRGR